jgi:poly-gamma-glutamate capsule biosynthesis protein CapA/YwtB (metallophosphatase superfamily)
MSDSTTMLAVGDVVLAIDEPDPESFFDHSRAFLRDADLVLGHVEYPYTYTLDPSFARRADPRNLRAMATAGFHVGTMAANHVFDAGVDGIRDTIATLREHNIVPIGAGMNLTEARQPAILTRGDTCALAF